MTLIIKILIGIVIFLVIMFVIIPVVSFIIGKFTAFGFYKGKKLSNTEEDNKKETLK
jgi:ABC-type Fe3+ transport system permease subunit